MEQEKINKIIDLARRRDELNALIAEIEKYKGNAEWDCISFGEHKIKFGDYGLTIVAQVEQALNTELEKVNRKLAES